MAVVRSDRTIRDTWYERYHESVNMSEKEMEVWAEEPCSKLGDGRAPIHRTLHLLRTKKGRWGDKEIRWAKSAVAFIARVKRLPAGYPAAPGCPSQADIRLKSRGFDIDRTIYHRKVSSLDTVERTERMQANPTRRRVYDAQAQARKMRETFADRPVEHTEKFKFSWPAKMQNVGDSLAVAYASDKWKPKNGSGHREVELYKHLAESRNRVLSVEDVIVDYDDHGQLWPVRGPMVSLASCPMPEHFAVLGLFEEIVIQLYDKGSERKAGFTRNPDVIHVSTKHAYLGGSYVQWSQLDSGRADEPFIFVYTKSDGVMFVVFGDELDVEKDGIVG